MIEDKELGLQIAENPTVAKWSEIKANAEKRIFDLKIEIEINEMLIEMASGKLVV
jgi:hypothetical protein